MIEPNNNFANPQKGPGLIGLFCLFALTLSMLLVACDSSGAALSNVLASTDSIVPGSTGIGKPAGAVEVRYTLGKKSAVTATLDGPVKSTLLSQEQTAGEHLLRFAGVVDTDEATPDYRVVRRVVPSGDYKITISTGDAQSSVGFTVGEARQDVPAIENFVLHPDTISPNSDALDDVAEATFRTNQTTTLSVDLYDRSGGRTAVLAPIKRGPGEQNVVISGQDDLGTALPDGVYTATVRATDSVGNRVEASKPITVEAGGAPNLDLVSVDFSPRQIIIGTEISVTVRVKNTGKVPLRTQGPDPGYTYTTNDTYASIEGSKWTDKAGLWRVGVDWDGNSGGGPSRYPFRWGFGKTLMPGEEVITGGKIRILKQERTMWFYAGVLQEGITIFLDRRGRTAIGVDF
ncbi:MAG: hypothetical protein ABI670_15295 [Chloroflexota bacterium]